MDLNQPIPNLDFYTDEDLGFSEYHDSLFFSTSQREMSAPESPMSSPHQSPITEVDTSEPVQDIHMEEALTLASNYIIQTSTMATQPTDTSTEAVSEQRKSNSQEPETGGERNDFGPIISSPNDSSNEDDGNLRLKVQQLSQACTYLVSKVCHLESQVTTLQNKVNDQQLEISYLREQLAGRPLRRAQPGT